MALPCPLLRYARKRCTLGEVTDARTHNEFGELDDRSVSFGVTGLYAVEHSYDKLGRIMEKAETSTGIAD